MVPVQVSKFDELKLILFPIKGKAPTPCHQESLLRAMHEGLTEKVFFLYNLLGIFELLIPVTVEYGVEYGEYGMVMLNYLGNISQRFSLR